MKQQYKYKLAISILTRNRKEFVEELLERLALALYDRNIGLYLLDGSDNNDLEIIVESYKKHGFDNIHYHYYDQSKYEEDTAFERFEAAGASVDAEYVWRCSDKFVPSKAYLNEVLEQLDKNYDIIVYNVLHWNGEVTKEYSDKVEFFRECAPKLQMLSVPILGRKIIDGFTKEQKRKTTEEKKYTEVDGIFQSIAEIQNFKGLLLCGTENKGEMMLRLVSNGDFMSGHVKQQTTFEWFIERMYNTVSELPSIYNSEKKCVMKNFSCHTWFSLEGFLKLRWHQGYYFKQCFKYMDKWKLVTNVPVAVILGIGLLPSPIARFLYKRVRIVKKKITGQCF